MMRTVPNTNSYEKWLKLLIFSIQRLYGTLQPTRLDNLVCGIGGPGASQVAQW